jgi:hypothetical protein
MQSTLVRSGFFALVIAATACGDHSGKPSGINPDNIDGGNVGSSHGDGGTGDGGNVLGDGCMPGAPGTLDSCLGFMNGPPVIQETYAASMVQSDGKIVVYGTVTDASAPGPHGLVVRYLPTGAVDTTFQAQLPAAQGTYYFHITDVVEAADHSLLLTGDLGEDTYNMQTAYVLQLSPSGAAVAGGLGGSLPVPNNNFSVGTKIVVASGGDFYVAGTATCSVTFTCDTESMFVAHFSNTGTLDTSYGASGFALATSGQHTSLVDATLTDAGIDVLGTESEPITVQGQMSSFNTAVVGALDTTGIARAGFGSAGVFTWYDPSTRYGSIAKAFHAANTGTITVDAALTSDTLLVIGSDGQLQTAAAYQNPVTAQLAPQFASDGSIFAVVNDYPTVRFAHFAADGTLDTAFQSVDIAVPGLPTGSAILGVPVFETSESWLATADIYLANSTPDDELVLFKVWK